MIKGAFGALYISCQPDSYRVVVFVSNKIWWLLFLFLRQFIYQSQYFIPAHFFYRTAYKMLW